MNILFASTQHENQEEVEVLSTVDELHNLVVYNDDFNTFEHVIETLISVCKHSPTQAEQCTYIIHYRGQCVVKKGMYEDLKNMQEKITFAGIFAAIS